MTEGFHLLDGATAPRGWTLMMRTARFGDWYLSAMAFAGQEEAALFAEDAMARWPGLVVEWQVQASDLAPTHTWSAPGGLTPIAPEETP